MRVETRAPSRLLSSMGGDKIYTVMKNGFVVLG